MLSGAHEAVYWVAIGWYLFHADVFALLAACARVSGFVERADRLDRVDAVILAKYCP